MADVLCLFVCFLCFFRPLVVMYGLGDPRIGRAADWKIAPFWLARFPLGCPTSHSSMSAVFQDGGRRHDAVFYDGSRCGGRVFSMDGDCLKVQGPVDSHWTRAGTGAEDHFRSAAAIVKTLGID